MHARREDHAFIMSCQTLALPSICGQEIQREIYAGIARQGGRELHKHRWRPALLTDSLAPAARMPTELLTVGRRVLLHGSAQRPNDTYGLLYSDDQGASFRGL